MRRRVPPDAIVRPAAMPAGSPRQTRIAVSTASRSSRPPQALLAGAVIDEPIRQAEVQHRRHESAGGHELVYRAAGATGHHLSSTVTRASWLRQLHQQRLIQRLDEAHVDHRGIERSPAASAAGTIAPKARIASSCPAGAARPCRPAARVMVCSTSRQARRRADSARRPGGPVGRRCRASAGIRSRRPAPSPPCSECSAGR